MRLVLHFYRLAAAIAVVKYQTGTRVFGIQVLLALFQVYLEPDFLRVALIAGRAFIRPFASMHTLVYLKRVHEQVK
jgi:hypothetical protein